MATVNFDVIYTETNLLGDVKAVQRVLTPTDILINISTTAIEPSATKLARRGRRVRFTL